MMHWAMPTIQPSSAPSWIWSVGIWAIGTGRTATSEQANDTIAVIRAEVRRMFGAAADKMRIQYGGSMKPQNAKELMAMSEIDGGLIGGASLKANDFAAIVHYDK